MNKKSADILDIGKFSVYCILCSKKGIQKLLMNTPLATETHLREVHTIEEVVAYAAKTFEIYNLAARKQVEIKEQK